MVKRLYILALIGLLLQCMPAKSCVLLDALVGQNCHKEDVKSGDSGINQAYDGCENGDEKSHSDACACEQPEPSSDRVVKVPVVGFNILGEVAFVVGGMREWEPSGEVEAVPVRPPLAGRLPLLN